MSGERERLRRLPAAVGGLAIVVGVVLGLLGPDRGSGGGGGGATAGDVRRQPAPEPNRPPDAPAEPTLPPYQPDLRGPDSGTKLVETRDTALALGVAAGHLVWLTTDAARLMAVPLGGGAARLLYAAATPDAFGGALAVAAPGMLWSVEQLDDGPARLLFLSAEALAASVVPPPLEVAAGATSPANLQWHRRAAWWTDRGDVWSLAEPGQAAARTLHTSALLTALAVDGQAIYWSAAPLDDRAGGHALRTARADGTLARTLLPAQRGQQRQSLTAAGGQLWWSEGPAGGWRLRRLEEAHGPARVVVRTGEVTALVVARGRLYWAEAHQAAGQTVSLLRAVPTTGGAAQRLGRHAGPVAALTVQPGALYFAGSSAIWRLPLTPPRH